MRRALVIAVVCLAPLAASAGPKEDATAAKLVLRAKTLIAAERHGEAEVVLRRAIALVPERGGPHFYLGKVLVRLGRCPEALAELDIYLAESKHGQNVEEAVALVTSCKVEPATTPTDPEPPVTEPEPGTAAPTTTPADEAGRDTTYFRPLTLARGVFQLRADVFVEVGLPIALAPDLSFGVTDHLTVGLTHDLGFCLSGAGQGCPGTYSEVGATVAYSVVRSERFEMAARGALISGFYSPLLIHLNGFDPLRLNLVAGGDLRWQRGRVAAKLTPRLIVPITARTSYDAGAAFEARLSGQLALGRSTWIEASVIAAEPLDLEQKTSAGTDEKLLVDGQFGAGMGVTFAASRNVDLGVDGVLLFGNVEYDAPGCTGACRPVDGWLSDYAGSVRGYLSLFFTVRR